MFGEYLHVNSPSSNDGLWPFADVSVASAYDPMRGCNGSILVVPKQPCRAIDDRHPAEAERLSERPGSALAIKFTTMDGVKQSRRAMRTGPAAPFIRIRMKHVPRVGGRLYRLKP